MSTKHDEVGRSSHDPLGAALALEKDGAHAGVLAILEGLLPQGESQGEAFKLAARSCFAAFLDPSILASWSDERRDALYRDLVLQEAGADEAPALHLCIASGHSGGVAGALAKSAEALTPVLSSLWGQGRREPSFLLMVLLLRRHLKDGWSREQISQWHLDLLPRFGRGHMSLPYNAAFDRENFRDNIDDVARVLHSSSTAELARQFAPWQIVLFHWMTQGRSLDPVLRLLIDALKTRVPEDVSAADAAALRSLSLRAAVLAKTIDAVDADSRALVAQWAGLRSPDRDDRGARRAADRLQSKPWQAIGAARGAVGRVAPYLKIGRRPPRIAVCISGQLRGYRRAFASWRPSILDGAECRFFLHVWKRLGRSGAEPFRAFLPFSGQAFCEAYRTEAHRIGMSETTARYPTLFSQLARSGEITKGELSAFYDTDNVVIEDDADESFGGWSNSRKMHHKIAAAQDLLEERQGEFDLIVRIRPDKELGLAAFVWSDLVKATARPVIFTDLGFGHQYAAPIIGDQFAIGAPGAMRVYADTVRITPQLAELGLFECPPEFYGHSSLARACWHAGIDVRRFPVRMGGLFESEPMRADEIAVCLAQDASGRMDAMDRTLLEANRRDLAS